MHQGYQNSILLQLRDSQIRYAPRDKRLQQLEAAEQLASEIDQQKVYTYEYVCFRITGYRPEDDAATQILGSHLVHDLRLLIDLFHPKK